MSLGLLKPWELSQRYATVSAIGVGGLGRVAVSVLIASSYLVFGPNLVYWGSQDNPLRCRYVCQTHRVFRERIVPVNGVGVGGGVGWCIQESGGRALLYTRMLPPG